MFPAPWRKRGGVGEEVRGRLPLTPYKQEPLCLFIFVLYSWLYVRLCLKEQPNQCARVEAGKRYRMRSMVLNNNADMCGKLILKIWPQTAPRRVSARRTILTH